MILKNHPDRQKRVRASVIITALIACGMMLSTIFVQRKQLIIATKAKLYALDLGYSRHPAYGKFLSLAPGIVKWKLRDAHNRPRIERIDIDLKLMDHQQLLADRERSIAAGFLQNPTEVPARINYRGTHVKAKVRLKGDLSDHWSETTRMSLRVIIKSGKAIHHFNKFSLQKPSCRQFPHDHIHSIVARQNGLLAPEHAYLDVYVNGVRWGIMNAEEHVSKELLEKQQRRESLVFRFGDDREWGFRVANEDKPKTIYPYSRLSDHHLYFRLYSSNKYLPSVQNRRLYTFIAESMTSPNYGHLFDTDAYSRMLALSAIWNSGHAIGLNNCRHYLNPYTLTLQPIPTDSTAPKSIAEMGHYPKFAPFSDASIYPAISRNSDYLSCLKKNYTAVARNLTSIQTTVDAVQRYFPLDEKIHMQNLIDSNIHELNDQPEIILTPPKTTTIGSNQPAKPISPPPPPTDLQIQHLVEHVHVRHYDDGNLLFFNLLPVAVQIETILLNNQPTQHDPISIPPYSPNSYDGIPLKTNLTGIRDGQLSIVSQYKNSRRTVHVGPTMISKLAHHPLRQKRPLAETPFLQKSDAENWQLTSGAWSINKPLVIPGNLEIQEGTTLSFAPDAYLIIRGALIAEGSAEKPITLQPSQENWKGIYVLQAKQESRLRHVNILRTQRLSDGLLTLTGAVTFYRSDVQFDNVHIHGTTAEDALNIVHSNFSLTAVTVEDTSSDGIDFDFATGTIRNCTLKNVKGDALDFSGSTVEIADTKVSTIHDKAVSAGEASTIKCTGLTLNDCGVGLASKDGSKLTADDIQITNYALAAAMCYAKKTFYDAPTLTATKINCSGKSGPHKYLNQKGSAMTINNSKVPGKFLDVDKLYESETMKK